MNPVVLVLFMLGSLIQVGGVVYAVLGFEEMNVPILIGAIVVGGLAEMLGVALLAMGRR